MRRLLLRSLLATLPPLLILEASRLIAGAPLTVGGLGLRWLLGAVILALAWLSAPQSRRGWRWQWSWAGLSLVGLALAAGLAYALTQDTAAAWLLLAVAYALLLHLDQALTLGRRRLVRLGVPAGLALTAGLAPVLLVQVETRFSEEEFFALLPAAVLALYWLALLLGWRSLHLAIAASNLTPPRSTPLSPDSPLDAPRSSPHPPRSLDIRWVAAGLAAIGLVGAYLAMRSYQRSFYPAQAPTFPGISAETPFLCGQAAADAQTTYTAPANLERLLTLVAANPKPQAPELGMLALGRQDPAYAEQFRQSLLAEAQQGRFSGPAGSVKSTQFDAAIRVYYYARVSAAFPGLFSPTEQASLRAWFAAIERRALTVEWVDWLYALALNAWPQGPYENQENGAGLLALLQANGLSDPALTGRSQAYLAANPRGWSARFRNTDDVAVYQAAWLYNAWFQSQAAGQAPAANVARSFEWLLIQALPDGAPLQYNHPAPLALVGLADLGARLTADSRYTWLAGRALDYWTAASRPLSAKPGAEALGPLLASAATAPPAAAEAASAPTTGSCLVYGDSGLPTQTGPLAPDKLVFRDGWSSDSAYLLLNLRFSGWHRYKATGAVTLLYQGGPLIQEPTTGQAAAWLPVGRSVWRDKRIPREALNGLQIARRGLSAVIYTLSGAGGPWAQDPPYYAQVDSFNTSAELDTAALRLVDWHGWAHQRQIYFYHAGPIVILDRAAGPAGQLAQLSWRLAQPPSAAGEAQPGAPAPLRLSLRTGAQQAEMLLIPLSGGTIVAPRAPNYQVQYHSTNGQLALATVFLTGRWVGAQVTLVDGRTLRLTQGSVELTLPVNAPQP